MTSPAPIETEAEREALRAFLQDLPSALAGREDHRAGEGQ